MPNGAHKLGVNFLGNYTATISCLKGPNQAYIMVFAGKVLFCNVLINKRLDAVGRELDVLERLPYKPEVVGSNPAPPTNRIKLRNT